MSQAPPEPERAPSLWQRAAGAVLANRLVVFVLIGVLAFFGLRYAPFDLGLVAERDPVPVDAIPDPGENQQIVFTEWPGRSPRDVDDQITYPLTTALLGIPGVRTVRSSSAFGFSSIYVIFEDDVEFYWARSRVLEKLASLPPQLLPEGVRPTLGPDATGLGQVYWYTLEGHAPDGRVVGGWDQDELRTLQDYVVRYALQGVAGVSEVASVGGHVREIQVDVDPEAMRAHGVSLAEIAAAVRESNVDIGARTIEINGVEYVIRGLGRLEDSHELDEAVVAVRDHVPIRLREVARVGIGPAVRRGALDDEGAPAVGGVVVTRVGASPLATIEAVRAAVRELAPSLPTRTLSDGTLSQVTIVPFYDRGTLIEETIGTLESALEQEILITLLVVLLLLGSLRSAGLISAILPLGVLVTFVAMRVTGTGANVMALGGIAIAIGTMVDVGIVFTEHIAHHLESHPNLRSIRERISLIRDATGEVAPAVTTSVLTTVVGFLPVLGLPASELRLFGPLALTKTFAMLAALALGFVLIPPLALLVLRPRAEPRAEPRDEGARGWRALLRPEHLRDLMILLVGVALWAAGARVAGALTVALALLRAAPLPLDEKLARWLLRAGHVLSALALSVGLATVWEPMGPGALLSNASFIGITLLLCLGTFELFARAYPAILRALLAHKAAFLVLPSGLVLLGLCAWLGAPRLLGWLPQGVRASAPVSSFAHAFPGLGREYMPPFDEGAFLYMPTTMPHASFAEAQTLLSEMDAAIAAIPEVDRVVGKLGRAESALDPAPVSMFETLVTYHPEWRLEEDGTRTRVWRDHIHSPADIWAEIVDAAQRPGLTSAPVLMPIQTRIVMLQSGMRAPMGVRVRGPDLESLERFSLDLEGALREVPGVRAEAVFAERVVGKPYLELELDREAIGRYGLSIADVQEQLSVALGGITLTRTLEGRERHPVRVRYMREERDSPEALERLAVPTPQGHSVPLGELASLRFVRGPQMIRSEDTFLTSYVLFDRDAGLSEVEAVDRARAALDAAIADGSLEVPTGVRFDFAGTFENHLRSERSLAYLVPIALALVFALLMLTFRRVEVTAMVFSGVAVAVSGAFLLLWAYQQPGFLDLDIGEVSLRALFRVGPVNLSVAVWIGIIALIGIATDDGVVMATHLTGVFRDKLVQTRDEVRALVVEAGNRRVRACLATTATTILALLPVITSRGRGADVMMPMALPQVGGMFVELLTLFVVPVLFCWVEERAAARRAAAASPGS